MADLGILRMTLPPKYGGIGMDSVCWAIAQEELARAFVVVADLVALAVQGVVAGRPVGLVR